MAGMKAVVRKYTPRPLWTALAAAKARVLDATDVVLGRRGDLVPPRRLDFVGGGDFLEAGTEFLGHFKTFAGLEPQHRVLDVGSGIGRMAIPLTGYLSSAGAYEGFDIVPQGVEWCTAHITPRFPNFRFQLADIRNREYNANGAVTADRFRFPYPDGSFDFVFLTSVFTHMMPPEVENYLREIHRVLVPNGSCLITWFLLNPGSRRLIEQGRSTLDFRYPVEGCLTTNPQVPEEAIAFDEQYVVDLYARRGFALSQPVRYGSWCGRASETGLQDICIARRDGTPATSRDAP